MLFAHRTALFLREPGVDAVVMVLVFAVEGLRSLTYLKGVLADRATTRDLRVKM